MLLYAVLNVCVPFPVWYLGQDVEFDCIVFVSLLFHLLNVMKPSDSKNIVSGFISRNEYILPMKFLNTLFQIAKREFGFKRF